MALPVHLLEQLPTGVTLGLGGSEAPANEGTPANAPSLPLHWLQLDEHLPDQGLLKGAVVELAVTGGASLATSIALAACRAAQHEALSQGGEPPWCAFIDPSATLYAPGVAQAGVALERLLVVRPELEVLARVALRVVESRAFALVVIDTVGMPGAASQVAAPRASGQSAPVAPAALALGPWARIVRRLSLAVEATEACVLLITDSAAARPVPLPVAMRIELSRPSEGRLSLRIAKDRRGRISGPKSIVWARPPTGEARKGVAWGRK
jgi:recombination protein RecA